MNLNDRELKAFIRCAEDNIDRYQRVLIHTDETAKEARDHIKEQLTLWSETLNRLQRESREELA